MEKSSKFVAFALLLWTFVLTMRSRVKPYYESNPWFGTESIQFNYFIGVETARKEVTIKVVHAFLKLGNQFCKLVYTLWFNLVN